LPICSSCSGAIPVANGDDVTAVDNIADPAEIWTILEEVKDPEIPVLSIVDLGIAREVKYTDDGRLEIVISPTYSG